MIKTNLESLYLVCNKAKNKSIEIGKESEDMTFSKISQMPLHEKSQIFNTYHLNTIEESFNSNNDFLIDF